MRVYVAGRWTRKDEVRSVQRMLREAGHEITHDWTRADDPPAGWSQERVRGYLAQQAFEDYMGVLAAEAVVILDDPTGRGLYVELGIALGETEHPKRIVVVGPTREVGACVFYFLPNIEYVNAPSQAVATLGRSEAA
jgi:hypothetical protein